jgi:hypothetical protein
VSAIDDSVLEVLCDRVDFDVQPSPLYDLVPVMQGFVSR